MVARLINDKFGAVKQAKSANYASSVFFFRKIGENYGHDDELCKKINLHNFKKAYLVITY